MKLLAIQTSPNHDGFTSRLAQAALEGAREQGAEVELVHLRSLHVEACRACEDGWGRCRREGLCIIEDDYQHVRDQMGAADAVVFSTPVYFGEVSEVTKNFFDRLRRCELAGPLESRIEGKPALGITAAGGSGGRAVSALHMLEQYLHRCRLSPFDLINATRRSAEYKLEAARAAGAALVRALEVPEE